MAAWVLVLVCKLPAAASTEPIYIQEDGFAAATEQILQLAALYWRDAVSVAVALLCTAFTVVIAWKRRERAGKREK